MMITEATATRKWFLFLREGRSWRLNIFYGAMELLCVAFAITKCWGSVRTSWPLLLLPLLFASFWRGVHQLLQVVDALDMDTKQREELADRLFTLCSMVPIFPLLFFVFR